MSDMATGCRDGRNTSSHQTHSGHDNREIWIQALLWDKGREERRTILWKWLLGIITHDNKQTAGCLLCWQSMNGTDIFHSYSPVVTILFYLFQMQLSVQLEKNVGRVHISPDTCPAHQTETSAASGFQGEWITTELYSSECGSPQNRSRVATVDCMHY